MQAPHRGIEPSTLVLSLPTVQTTAPVCRPGLKVHYKKYCMSREANSWSVGCRRSYRWPTCFISCCCQTLRLSGTKLCAAFFFYTLHSLKQPLVFLFVFFPKKIINRILQVIQSSYWRCAVNTAHWAATLSRFSSLKGKPDQLLLRLEYFWQLPRGGLAIWRTRHRPSGLLTQCRPARSARFFRRSIRACVSSFIFF